MGKLTSINYLNLIDFSFKRIPKMLLNLKFFFFIPIFIASMFTSSSILLLNLSFCIKSFFRPASASSLFLAIERCSFNFPTNLSNLAKHSSTYSHHSPTFTASFSSSPEIILSCPSYFKSRSSSKRVSTCFRCFSSSYFFFLLNSLLLLLLCSSQSFLL